MWTISETVNNRRIIILESCESSRIFVELARLIEKGRKLHLSYNGEER